MSQVRFFVFAAVLCSCVLLGRGDIAPPETKLVDVSPVAPVVVSTEPSSPEASDVTHPKPDTTTTTTTTTTEAPTTTSTTTTTTEAPTTTSTTTPPPPPPTPAPKPKPVPAPEQGTWMYTDEHNVTCIVMQFSAQLNVSYNQNVDNTTRTASVLVNVPSNASLVTVTGSCNGSEYIQLTWASGAPNSSVANSLRVNFLRNETTKVYAVQSMNVTVDAKILVNSSAPGDKVRLSYGEAWQTPVGTSYRCSQPTQLNLTSSESDSGVAASIVIAQLQEEAYRTTFGKGFSAARDCGGADLPDAVPIAVGCALGGLVLVVLVAYLVARRRSAARGYLSM